LIEGLGFLIRSWSLDKDKDMAYAIWDWEGSFGELGIMEGNRT